MVLLEDGGRFLGSETADKKAKADERGGHEKGRARPQPNPPRRRKGCGRGRLAHRTGRERVERERDVARRLEPVVGVFFETPPHELVESRRRRAAGHRHRRGVAVEDGRERVRPRASFESAPPAQHLVEHRPKGEDVRPRVCRPPAELLRRDVPRRPHPRPSVRLCPGRLLSAAVVRRLRQTREAEVEELDVSLADEEEVLRLQVPVDDTVRVRRREGLRDLATDLDRLADGHRTPREPLAQCLAVQQLEDDVRAALVCSDVVDGQDPRVL